MAESTPKPAYGPDEVPKPALLISLTLQMTATALIFLLITRAIAVAANASASEVASMISITMIAQAIGTALMSLRESPITAGMAIPIGSNTTFLAPSLLAAEMGGLPLVWGMTIFSGVVQAAFSYLLRHMRLIFSAEVGFMLVFLIGLGLGSTGVHGLLKEMAVAEADPTLSLWLQPIIALLAFIALYFCRFAFGGALSQVGLLIVYVLGYLVLWALAIVPDTTLATVRSAPWIAMPQLLSLQGVSFKASLMIPWIVASLICTLKVIGVGSAVQRLCSPDWQRPDVRNLARANLVDAIATTLSGLGGGTGINVLSSTTALTLSTRIASRAIGYGVAICVFLLAFCTKIAMLLALTPGPLQAAIFAYLGVTLVVTSLKFLAPYMTRARVAIPLATGILFGLSYDLYPAVYSDLGATARLFTGSAIALAATVTISLHLAFNVRLMVTRRAILRYSMAPSMLSNLHQSLMTHTEQWNLPTSLAEEVGEQLVKLGEATEKLEPERRLVAIMTLDALALRVAVSYRGDRLPETTIDDLKAEQFETDRADARSHVVIWSFPLD